MVYLTDRITLDANLCNGRPTVRGLRISVQTVLEFLFAGDSSNEIIAQYPILEEEDISACQQFAIDLMGRQYI
ncbi:MAG: DUF433 domain-containing protein [Bacteroidota bacterium]